MLNSKLELYLNGSWEEFHIYNRCAFDDRADGQLNSGVCYIITNARRTDFKPKRRARLTTWDDNGEQWERSFFAYFKGQQRGPAYWMWEVTLVGIEQQVQRQMIDGMRVIQNENSSITLYNTLQRLCDITPLRLVGQTQKYRITTDAAVISVLQKIPSPEYAWSCRTLLWECLKEIGCDMGGYLPEVQWYDNADGTLQYEIGFFPTGKITETLTDLHYVSYAMGHEVNDVCSAVDTDIANIIPANQETASVVYPAPNAWVTPRTEDVRITTDNCKIILPEIIEKILKIYVNTTTFEVRVYQQGGGGVTTKSAYEILGINQLDVTKYFPEYKKWQTLLTFGGTNNKQTPNLYKNNTCCWQEDTELIELLADTYYYGDIGEIAAHPAYENLLDSAILNKYGTYIGNNEWVLHVETEFDGYVLSNIFLHNIRDLQFRIEYIPRGNSTKLHAVKQEQCDYESVIPFNQRAEIVDAESLSRELKKEVNQRGVDYAKLVHFYTSLAAVPQRGAAFTVGNDQYTITVNEYEQTNNQNIKVTHTFAKNWVLQSSYLKQNKEYRNTNIPTDILERNLHYEDYIVIDESHYSDNDGALINGTTEPAETQFLQSFSMVFLGQGGAQGYYSEVNAAAFYGREFGGVNNEGGIVSVSSFAVANSIVFSAKTKNNLSVGIRCGDPGDDEDDDYCYDVFYTNDDGELDNNVLAVKFGVTLHDTDVDSYPFSHDGSENSVVDGFAKLTLYVDKSSGEQTNLTYQAHVVSALTDVIVGEMITRNNPLVCETNGTEEKTFQLWGLTQKLPKMATVVDTQYGAMLATWSGYNSEYIYVFTNTNRPYFDLTYYISNVNGLIGGGYVGWAVTDENGRLYLARNKEPDGDETLCFNYRHTFHGEE